LGPSELQTGNLPFNQTNCVHTVEGGDSAVVTADGQALRSGGRAGSTVPHRRPDRGRRGARARQLSDVPATRHGAPDKDDTMKHKAAIGAATVLAIGVGVAAKFDPAGQPPRQAPQPRVTAPPSPGT